MGYVAGPGSEGGCDISVITTRDGAVRGNIYSNVYSTAIMAINFRRALIK